MKKKSKQNNLFDYVLLGTSALFGVLTLLLMIAPGIITKIGMIEARYNLYELINYADELRVGLLFALIFAVVLLVATVLLLLLKLLNKKFKLEPLFALCSAILALVAGILFFCTKALVGLADSGITSLGIGAVLSAIFSILASASLGFYAVKKMLK